MKNTFLTLGFISIIQFASAQEPITDFFSQEGDKSSRPLHFVEFNQKFVFQAFTESTGREIWMNDGENESYLLKDINPGKASGGIRALSQRSVVLDNTLYFIANDGISNGEIWKTNGTPEGTEKITNFLNSDITQLTLVGDNFYFFIINDDGSHLWVSDGSADGTKLVQEKLPISGVSFQGKCKSTFIFTATSPGANPSRVWRSDGTAAGTYPITDELTGNGIGSSGTFVLSQYIEFNDELYFVSSRFIHKTDGTLENTKTVTSYHTSPYGSLDAGFVAEADGKLFFSFYDLENNRLIVWESDGTLSGSKKIYDESGFKHFTTSNLLGEENALIFCGPNDSGGTSLISLDLTDYGVSFIKELENSDNKPRFVRNSRNVCSIQIIPGDLIFCSSPVENDQNNGWNGWLSGLTEETTINVEALNDVPYVFSFNNSIYFFKATDLEGIELWRSDTEYQNFYLFDNINKSKYGLFDQPLQTLNSNLLFTADDGAIGNEIWTYDGTLSLLKDINPGPASSASRTFTRLEDSFYFQSNDGVNGYEFWRTDGTEAGTQIAHDIVEGAVSSFPRYLTHHKGNIFFSVRKDNHYHLCKSDGTNFEFLLDLGENQFGAPLSIKGLKSSGDYVYLIGYSGGRHLWRSDGTVTGTVKLKDFVICENLTDVNGKLFFTASEPSSGEIELWSTDGSESNTTQVADIDPGHSSEPRDLVNLNGQLFFTAVTIESGRELWKTDGTENGTRQVVDLNPGGEGSFTNANFYASDNTLYFSASNGVDGFELWKSDGTDAGTEMIADINQGSEGSFPSQFKAVNELIYFQAFDNQHGFELWKTNGTAAGTLLEADIYPGDLSSCPSSITSINDNIFFTAESIGKGRQIWKIPYAVITSITEPLNEYQIKVYPNPTYGMVKVQGQKQGYSVVTNLLGQTVLRSDNHEINLQSKPSGIYILNLHDARGTILHRTKLIKK